MGVGTGALFAFASFRNGTINILTLVRLVQKRRCLRVSKRLIPASIVAVILTLTLAGAVMGDGVVTPPEPDPGELGGLGEQANELTRDLRGDGSDDPDQQRACQRGLLGAAAPLQSDEDCEKPAEDPEPETPATNETGPTPEVPEVPPLDQVVQDLGGDILGEAEEHGSSLMRTIWKPLQDVSQDAGRLIQDVYGTAGQTLDKTTKSLAKTAEQTTALAVGLVDQAARDAQMTLGSLVSTVNDLGHRVLGFLPDLWGLLDDGSTSASESQSEPAGAGSATVKTPAPTTFALGMILASGLGLALAGMAALRRLLGLGGVALLSRIPSSQIMKNGTRNAIFQIVRSDPGVSLNEIVERVGLSRNAVAYHLAVFESEKLMTSVKDGKYRRYFLNGGRYVNGAKDVVAAIKNDTTLDVIRYIAQNPGTIQKEVCNAVGTSPSATSWHIRRLERVGLVEKQRVANMVKYSPGPNLARYDLSEFGLNEAQPVLA